MAGILSASIDAVLERGASDLHFTVGQPVRIRIDGAMLVLRPEPITAADMETILKDLLPPTKQRELERDRSVDVSYAVDGKARFRVNAYFSGGVTAAALRLIPATIQTPSDLGLPDAVVELVASKQGMILAVGPAGQGKTTTIASLVEEVNRTREGHIITIEDPIEYLFVPKKCQINQREIGQDAKSFPHALRMALRQDPDVVFVGEMRDLETITAAITLAETGHLIFSTLHTNDAAQTIDRMVDVFPPHQQQQVRLQLADSLVGIVSQRLVPKTDGGRVLASELLIATPAVRNLIREGKAYQIKNVIQTGAEERMYTIEMSLAALVKAGAITEETAYAYALDRKQLANLL